MAREPAYTRLQTDERRRQLIDAVSVVFAEHAFEEISMREIAQAAGVSKALLYHYFPTKADLFSAAVEDKTLELQQTLETDEDLPPLEQLTTSIDCYLRWIERNRLMWAKLMQSAATLPQAHDAVEQFRAATRERILSQLIGPSAPPAAVRNAVAGWLGYVDAAILDWIEHDDISIAQLTELLAAAFVAALLAAQQADPHVELRIE